jgi:uncharacterized protein YceK
MCWIMTTLSGGSSILSECGIKMTLSGCSSILSEYDSLKILEHSESMIFIQHIHLDSRTSRLCDLHTTYSLKILDYPDSVIIIQHIHLRY